MSNSDNADLRSLADVLARQPADGGLQYRHAIYAGDGRYLTNMIVQQWKEMPKLEMRPGMSAAACRKMLKNSAGEIWKIIFARQVILLLEELRHMIQHEIPVSGRLLIETNASQQRVLTWRGVGSVKAQFRVPTLLLDATLPAVDVLKVTHPRATLKADIRVAMPTSVQIRQILHAPTSKTKLIDGKHSKKHRDEMRRHILQRWLETGRKTSLVIAQMEFAEWLRDKLPTEIAVGHYNAVAGLDQYRDVRLLILIGRTQPGPEAVETLAATLSGSMPSSVVNDEKFSWYTRVRRGIRLRDGSGVAVIGDQHPDEFCESIRQQITEAELVQALGRARAVNRTEQTPLAVDLLFDTVLPIEVDEVDIWKRPSRLIATAAEGVILTAPCDMTKIWPEIWPNTRAADRTLARKIPTLPGFKPVSYKLLGQKIKNRTGYFDRGVIPDPVKWLASRLGALAVKP